MFDTNRMGRGPGAGNGQKTITNMGLANPNTYISHKVLLNLVRHQYGHSLGHGHKKVEIGFKTPSWYLEQCVLEGHILRDKAPV